MLRALILLLHDVLGECYDATQEEMCHWIHSSGFVEAYPKYFDNKWYANGKTSNLTRAMDIAR